MHTFWSFARAPLAWSLAILALYAPFGFLDPVLEPPPCNDGWFDCPARYSKLVFDPAPHSDHLYALLVVPSAFIALLAARIAARGPTRQAHWFMAGPVLAIVACQLFVLLVPIHLLLIDTAASDHPAMIVAGVQAGMMLGMLGALTLAVLTLLGALAWRHRPRDRAGHNAATN